MAEPLAPRLSELGPTSGVEDSRTDSSRVREAVGDGPPRMRKRVAARWGIAIGAVAAALGHFAYWYLPRERAGAAPSPEALALLAEPDRRAAVWIAYPHQNLGKLEQFVGDVAAWGSLVANREEREATRIPSFGPFVAPPASELAVAVPSDAAGEREPSAMVRTYPSVAYLARAAGRLAGNPWLSGGSIEGTPQKVTWDGDLWSYGEESNRAAPGGSGEGSEAAQGALALLRTAARLGPLPPGTYRLARGEEGIELTLGHLDQARPLLPEGAGHPAAVLAERAERRQLSIIVVWEDDGIVPPFPAAASIVRRGTPRPRLPGEDLLRLAGRKPKRAVVDGFEIAGLTNGEVERASALLPELIALASYPPGARAVAIVDPAAALRIARRLQDGFAAFPLAALLGEDPQRWSGMLGPWQACGPMALLVSKRGDEARAWLCPPTAAANEPPPAAPAAR